jgi:UTP-glucose-1-phosphate uridylyltransferase
METRQTTLVLLAAGMGSRYGGVKQIDGVGPGGEAIIDYSIYDALEAGFTDLCFIVRAEIEEAVREFFDGKFPADVGVSFAIQSLTDIPGNHEIPADRAKPWGTAHAVYAARHAVKNPFAVVNADDFYGRDSYRQLHHYLVGKPAESTDYAMVGFRLDETLSPHGTVSRGICRADSEGYLQEIVEHTKIQKKDSIESLQADGSVVELSADSIASMNMFGFTPAVFGQIEVEFEKFLQTGASNPKSEFYIPSLMTGLINSGDARMQVLPTSSQWFGMTYREDRAEVESRIRGYVDGGDYPQKLWNR